MWAWGQEMSVFVHAEGIKTVHARRGWWSKMAKLCPQRFGWKDVF